MKPKSAVPRYATETPEVRLASVNQSWVRQITGEEGDNVKKAAVDETEDFTRVLLRQEAFSREILVPRLIREDQLDKARETDQPRKIVEREYPYTYATWVPFHGTGPQIFFRGSRYEVRFGKLESLHFWKDKFSLMTYSVDIRKIFADNAVRDLADQEDTQFIRTINAILARRPAQVITAGAFSPKAFALMFQAHLKRRQPIGRMLMTQALMQEAINLPATQIGNEIVSKIFNQGVEEGTPSLWKVPVTATIKNWIVDGPGRSSVYLFGPDTWLGKFYILQDATLFIEQRGPNIHFYLYEALGIGIGNDLDMTRLDLPPI